MFVILTQYKSTGIFAADSSLYINRSSMYLWHMLNVIQCLEQTQQCNPRQTQQPSDSAKNHLELLDLLALLLVTEAQGDVAAITISIREKDIYFYYTKNRPANYDERKYVDILLRTVQRAVEGTIPINNS